MKFGTFALPTYFPERDGTIERYYEVVLNYLAQTEELGFDSVWVNEHHFHPFGGMIPNPAVMLGALAASTKRMRIGTSVSLLPLHNPIELAEAYAMVDQISGGRLEFGIGKGFSAHDFEKMHVNYDDAQERMYESLDIILKAWTQQPFSHKGDFYHFEDVSVWPPVAQKPHPPIWMAATRNPHTFDWIGERGYHLLTVAYVKTLDELSELVARYRKAARGAGHDVSKLQVATHYQVCLHEDAARAREIAIDALDRYLELSAQTRKAGVSQAMTGKDLVDQGRVLAGSPDECVDTIRKVSEELGLTSVDCTFYFGGIDHEFAHHSLNLFAEHVMPALRSFSVT